MSQLLLAVERAAAQRRLLIEREQLRLHVQHEAERLRALITNTGDAILSANADGILQIVNLRLPSDGYGEPGRHGCAS